MHRDRHSAVRQLCPHAQEDRRSPTCRRSAARGTSPAGTAKPAAWTKSFARMRSRGVLRADAGPRVISSGLGDSHNGHISIDDSAGLDPVSDRRGTVDRDSGRHGANTRGAGNHPGRGDGIRRIKTGRLADALDQAGGRGASEPAALCCADRHDAHRPRRAVSCDLSRQQDGNGTATANFGSSRGLELIPTTRLEIGISPPPYLTHQSSVPDGFGDMSFQVKYRVSSAPEGKGDYFVGVFFGGSLPTGTAPNGADHARRDQHLVQLSGEGSGSSTIILDSETGSLYLLASNQHLDITLLTSGRSYHFRQQVTQQIGLVP